MTDVPSRPRKAPDEATFGGEDDESDGPGRYARARQRVDAAVERGRDGVEALRQRSTAVDVALATHERDRQTVGNVLAGAVAFRLFIYLLPLFLTVVLALGVLIGLERDAVDDASDQLGLSGYVADSVETAAHESRRSLWILAPLTLWAVYSGGVGAAKVLRAVHSVAWGQPVERLRRRWLAALVTFGLTLAVGLTTAGLQAVRQDSAGLGLVFLALQAVILEAVAWVAIRLLPHDPEAGARDLLPGAVLVGFGAWLLHAFSVYFLAHRVSSASELYGSLGVAAALLAWLYLLGRLLVASAMLNATMWHRRQAHLG